MSKKIKVESLEQELNTFLKSYKKAVDEDVVQVTDKVTKAAINELKTTSPRRKGTKNNPYWRGWASKLKKRSSNNYTKVIWNKTNYQLTHLLEFGHVTRNGGRAKAIPHIRPVEEKYNAEFVDLLKQTIRRTK